MKVVSKAQSLLVLAQFLPSSDLALNVVGVEKERENVDFSFPII